MALTERGNYKYGESQADIRLELAIYANGTGYAASHFADAACTCGGRSFKLLLDDREGMAVRHCPACQNSHPIAETGSYLDDAALEECECPCGAALFEVTMGVSLYHETEEVRWLFLGCRCLSCGLTACYGDWKEEFQDYRKLLATV
jgi:hypothetical protein